MSKKIKKAKKLFGWAGPNYDYFQSWDDFEKQPGFTSFQNIAAREGYRDTEGERVVLWECEKQLLGDYIPNVPQEIGDCVSWGMKHAVDRLACWEILRLGQGEEFHESFAPYFYGISRVQIGGGRLGGGDGSLGIWAADGVKQYGVLRSNFDNVPSYSGRVAKSWGADGPPPEFQSEGKQHLVNSYTRIKSYEELRDAICNGYPCTIASSRGWNMQLAHDRQTNKHWWTGRDSWMHQMCFIGVDDDPRRPGAYRENSLGPNAHGPQADGPPGGGWQDADDIDRELRDRNVECIAISQFDGFPAQMPNYDYV